MSKTAAFSVWMIRAAVKGMFVMTDYASTNVSMAETAPVGRRARVAFARMGTAALDDIGANVDAFDTFRSELREVFASAWSPSAGKLFDRIISTTELDKDVAMVVDVLRSWALPERDDGRLMITAELCVAINAEAKTEKGDAATNGKP